MGLDKKKKEKEPRAPLARGSLRGIPIPRCGVPETQDLRLWLAVDLPRTGRGRWGGCGRPETWCGRRGPKEGRRGPLGALWASVAGFSLSALLGPSGALYGPFLRGWGGEGQSHPRRPLSPQRAVGRRGWRLDRALTFSLRQHTLIRTDSASPPLSFFAAGEGALRPLQTPDPISPGSRPPAGAHD